MFERKFSRKKKRKEKSIPLTSTSIRFERNGNKFLVRENYGKREDEGGELVLYEMMAV